MALEPKKIGDYIKSKNLKLNDDFYSLKNKTIDLFGNSEFVTFDLLHDVNDVKTNSYSNLFLTKKQKNSNILKIKELPTSQFKDFVTPLSFFSADRTDKLNPPIWVTIDKGFDEYDVDTTGAAIKLIDTITSFNNNFLFRIECISETECIISHTFGDSIYYLTYDNGLKTSLYAHKDKSYFTYCIEDNKLRLYKVENGTIRQVICRKAGSGWILDLEGNEVDKEYAIIYINHEEEDIRQFINSSWVTYERKNNISKIDKNKSSFDLESQFLVHHEYAEGETINILPLKNNLTYQGTVTNGTNFTLPNNGKYIHRPLVDFRNYTSINSGLNQELGTENITLTFTFSDQLYHLNDGDECIITIPHYDEDESLFPPLYPYLSLNLNHTSFIRNGAFASNIPYFADKFSKIQNHNTEVNSSTYLCSWLYQKDDTTAPTWLDRYYYPDYIARQNALTAECFAPSFENTLDKVYFEKDLKLTESGKEQLKAIKDNLREQPYFDKISDLAITPGTVYKYSRLSKDMVNEVLSNMNNNRIAVAKNQNFETKTLENILPLNSENWLMVDATAFKKTKAITFNTDIYINPAKKMGIQLFGCDYNNGFNIQNRKDLTPFTYIATEKGIYLMNNEYYVANELNVYEKYEETIKYAVISEAFEDVYIFTDKSILILEYDLKIKNKLDLYDIFEKNNLSDMYHDVSSTFALYHKNSIYTVVNSGNNILKISFDKTDDNKNDISCRILSKGEYLTNFNLQNTGLIQTNPIIKSIFIKDDIIYAFNYDILKLSHDGDTIYGLIKTGSEVDDPWYYVFNQSLSKLYISTEVSKYAEFSSEVSIDNIAFGNDGSFALVRGFQNEEKDKTLEIYDKSKTKIYNYPLDGYNEIVSLDYYRYINTAHEECDVFVAVLKNYSLYHAVEYDITNQKVRSRYINIELDDPIISTFKNVIDSNKFIDKLNENKLYFNLYPLDAKTPVTHVWDLTEAQEGWYNINVSVDTDNAEFIIKINDETVGEYNNSTHSEFKPYLHNLNTIFDSNYYIGTLGKKYGSNLAEIIGMVSNLDPYTVTNTKIEHTNIYNKVLSYYEYQAMRLKYSKINPLVLTLPCGVRNGIEEIIRYFKYSKPASISNKVKINISGIDKELFLENDLDILKNDILNSVSNVDYLTTINEINFI